MVGVGDDCIQFHAYSNRFGLCNAGIKNLVGTDQEFRDNDWYLDPSTVSLFFGAMKQVLVIRNDLNMRKGKMIAQGAHASVLAVLWYLWHPFTWWWVCTKFTKIAVSVDSEHQLLELFHAAERQLPRSLVRDAGKTEFHGKGTWTAVAIGPGPNKSIDKITGHLKLL